MGKKTARKNVSVTFDQPTLEWVRLVSRLAQVTPTQVFNVLMAMHLSRLPTQKPKSGAKP